MNSSSISTKWSRLKKLTFSWIFFEFLFLASAVVLIITAAIWSSQDALQQHTLRRMTISQMDLNAAIVLGVIIIIAAILGITGFYLGSGKSNGRNQMGMIIFNWGLVMTIMITVIIGSIIWFYTLTERKDFAEIWVQQTPSTQAFLQDSLSCCGYWNATTAGLLTTTTGFCSTVTDLSTAQGCVTPVTKFADFLLNNVFSTLLRHASQIYGFTAVQVALLATSCCLIIARKEEDRFRKIDEKMGGRFYGGFV